MGCLLGYVARSRGCFGRARRQWRRSGRPHAIPWPRFGDRAPAWQLCMLRCVRLLLVAPETVGPRMTAGGIRYAELSARLDAEHDVTLAAPEGSEPVGKVETLKTYDPQRPKSLTGLVEECDLLFAPPLPPRLFGGLRSPSRPWVVDLLNPEPFEGLEYHKNRSRLERRSLEIVRIDRISYSLRTGCAFVCAGDRQRDMWLGYLAACRRLDSGLYQEDPHLRGLIDVVPSGIPESLPPRPPQPVLRGPVFDADARIVLWNGGIWDWFDPITVIRAVALLRRTDRRWVLAFAGLRRPSHRRPMIMTERAVAAAHETGLVADGAVYFNEGWTPYDARAGMLLEADVGVSAHLPTLETRFAFRNRLLDCVWAGLPIVCSAGDELGDRVESDGWGEAVAQPDVAGFAAALARVGDRGRGHYTAALSAGADEYSWGRSATRLLAVFNRVGRHVPGRRRSVVAAALAARHGGASRVRSPS